LILSQRNLGDLPAANRQKDIKWLNDVIRLKQFRHTSPRGFLNKLVPELLQERPKGPAGQAMLPSIPEQCEAHTKR